MRWIKDIRVYYSRPFRDWMWTCAIHGGDVEGYATANDANNAARKHHQERHA